MNYTDDYTKIEFDEDIRLLIWDLDDTFWEGTLTEGGITYISDWHNLVIDLAKRGIMSTICSKNDLDPVKDVLIKKNIWDYFIFPSIDWSPKGPRIKEQLQRIGLRAASCLFIDDNKLNLQEAKFYNEGINVALPAILPAIRCHDRLQGKDDHLLTRLEQYKIKERKLIDQGYANSDTLSFLRSSNVKIYFEYDVEKHINRAVELINRTNQLNFTKKRLSEDVDAAKIELRDVLRKNTTDAALIRVVDNYGDYGFVGLYVTHRHNNQRELIHFLFSCRIINMYIEHWVYKFLNYPKLNVKGRVISDIENCEHNLDWMTGQDICYLNATENENVCMFDYIYARGGCDLSSLVHYFSSHTHAMTEEFNEIIDGQPFRRDHTSFLLPSLRHGLSQAELDAARLLGYDEYNFSSEFGRIGKNGRTLYLLSFWADVDIPTYTHKGTKLCVPYWLPGSQGKDLISDSGLRSSITKGPDQKKRLEVLCEEFTHDGILAKHEMVQRYTNIFDNVPSGAQAVVLLANEKGLNFFDRGNAKLHPAHKMQNEVIRTVAKGRSNILLVNTSDFIQTRDDLFDANHFRRDVYHKLYRRILDKIDKREIPNNDVEGNYEVVVPQQYPHH